MRKADAHFTVVAIFILAGGIVLMLANTAFTKTISGQQDTIFCQAGILSKEPNLERCQTRFIEISGSSISLYSAGDGKRKSIEDFSLENLNNNEKDTVIKKTLADSMADCKNTIPDGVKNKYEKECIICWEVYFTPSAQLNIQGFHSFLSEEYLDEKTYAQRFYLQPGIPGEILLPNRITSDEQYEIYLLLDGNEENVVVDMATSEDILASDRCKIIY